MWIARLGEDEEDWTVDAGRLIRDLVDSYSGHLRWGRSTHGCLEGKSAIPRSSVQRRGSQRHLQASTHERYSRNNLHSTAVQQNGTCQCLTPSTLCPVLPSLLQSLCYCPHCSTREPANLGYPGRQSTDAHGFLR